MLWFSVGMPTQFSEWCDRVTLAVVRRQKGPAAFAAANTLEEVARVAIMAKEANVVIGARQPGDRLRCVLAEANSPFILSVSDPRSAVAEMMVSRNFDLPSAVRAVASSYGAILRYARLPGALLVRSTERKDEAAGIVASIGRHLGDAHHGELPDEQFTTGPTERLSIDVEAWWRALGDREQAIVDGALAGYAKFVSSGVIGPLNWESSLFFLGGAPDIPVPQAIDITGRPRCFLYGPFIHLPPGAWIVTVTLGCSQQAAGTPFMIEAFAGVQLAQTRLQPSNGGVFEVTLAFRIEENSEAADHPFQVRLFTERSVFDGRVGLGTVIAAPQNTASPQLREALGEALGISP